MTADALAEALARLPHGPEFRFLDRLVRLDPGKSGAGEYTVRGDEPFLRGHFPGDPLMPGVLLVEAAAQLTGRFAQTVEIRGILDPQRFGRGQRLIAHQRVVILASANSLRAS